MELIKLVAWLSNNNIDFRGNREMTFFLGCVVIVDVNEDNILFWDRDRKHEIEGSAETIIEYIKTHKL